MWARTELILYFWAAERSSIVSSMLASIGEVEESAGARGKIKLRRLIRVAPLSGSWTTGSGDLALGGTKESVAPWISAPSTGEKLAM